MERYYTSYTEWRRDQRMTHSREAGIGEEAVGS